MSIRTARRIAASLPLTQSADVSFLRKGFSQDKKYVLSVDGQPRYLLRMSPLAEEPRRRAEFGVLGQLAAGGIACSQPLEFGVLEAGGVCFSLLSYLPGECAEEVLPALPAEQQYAIGVQAGQELARLHAALRPTHVVDWYTYRVAKYTRQRAAAHERGLTFPQQAEIECFVEEHLPLLHDRPVTIQHDDYHPGNLIVHAGQFAGVIDFNRYDWGDPFHDFYKVGLLTIGISPAFARGQVDGYFAGAIPATFWPLYTLYLAMMMHGDLVWTQRWYPRLLRRSQRNLQRIIATHDFAGGNAPQWYGECIYIQQNASR